MVKFHQKHILIFISKIAFLLVILKNIHTTNLKNIDTANLKNMDQIQKDIEKVNLTISKEPDEYHLAVKINKKKK